MTEKTTTVFHTNLTYKSWKSFSSSHCQYSLEEANNLQHDSAQQNWMSFVGISRSQRLYHQVSSMQEIEPLSVYAVSLTYIVSHKSQHILQGQWSKSTMKPSTDYQQICTCDYATDFYPCKNVSRSHQGFFFSHPWLCMISLNVSRYAYCLFLLLFTAKLPSQIFDVKYVKRCCSTYYARMLLSGIIKTKW